MALTMQSGLTQETFDAIAQELLIKPDDAYPFLELVQPMVGTFEAGAKTITFNQPNLPDGTFTEASRRLTEGTAISTGAKAISMATKTLTPREYAGPYDSGAVTPFGITEKLVKMAKHQLIPMLGEFLRRDRNKWLDNVRRADMLSSTLIVTPDGSDSGTIASGVVASAAWLRRLNKKMKDLLIPRFPNGRWRLIISTQQEQELKSDPELQRVFAQFAGMAQPSLTGQVATYENFDIYLDTLMPTDALGSGSSVTCQQAVAFGPYHLGTGVISPVSVRQADDTDFQRQQRIIWHSIEAHGSLYADTLVVKGITSGS